MPDAYAQINLQRSVFSMTQAEASGRLVCNLASMRAVYGFRMIATPNVVIFSICEEQES